MERESTLFKMFGKFYPQGTILFKENDPGDEMYYIQSGAIRLTESGGTSDKVQILGPGNIMGEESLFQPLPRKVMAEVVEDSRLLVINHRNLASLVRNGPELSASIIGEITRRLDNAWSGLRAWQQDYFLEKLEVFLRRSEKGRVCVISEVSKETGIEEEGVARVFDRLVRNGAFAREGDDFVVVDLSLVTRLTNKAG